MKGGSKKNLQKFTHFEEDNAEKRYRKMKSFEEISERGEEKTIDSEDEETTTNNLAPTKISKCNITLILGKNDPQNKEFEFHYEIQCHGQFDFFFEFRGELDKTDFAENTKILRSYPRHLKYTLFANDKIKHFRLKDFSFVYYFYEELKKKGNRLYKRGKFRESIDLYIEVNFPTLTYSRHIAYLDG